MTIPTLSQIKRVAFPILAAGLVGEIAFELYAWLVSPALFGFSLQPAKLVMAIAAQYFGMSVNYTTAFAVHFLIGSLLFGACVYLALMVTASTGFKTTRKRADILLSGLLTGLALWFVAQGVLAPMIGRSFMMDFGPYTQSSLIGHVGMTVIIAFALSILASRRTGGSA